MNGGCWWLILPNAECGPFVLMGLYAKSGCSFDNPLLAPLIRLAMLPNIHHSPQWLERQFPRLEGASQAYTRLVDRKRMVPEAWGYG